MLQSPLPCYNSMLTKRTVPEYTQMLMRNHDNQVMMVPSDTSSESICESLIRPSISMHKDRYLIISLIKLSRRIAYATHKRQSSIPLTISTCVSRTRILYSGGIIVEETARRQERLCNHYQDVIPSLMLPFLELMQLAEHGVLLGLLLLIFGHLHPCLGRSVPSMSAACQFQELWW